MTVDDFNKLALAVVALVALFLGPWMQWRIAKKQVQMQAEIAERQTETQSRIATRQIADNISSKRQHWIDELRHDAAEFLTVAGRLQELRRPRVEKLIGSNELAKDFKERLEVEMRTKELSIRIRLRLNPNEIEHNKLLELINKMASNLHEVTKNYSPAEERQIAAAFNGASEAFAKDLQAILKHEWERVKKGDV